MVGEEEERKGGRFSIFRRWSYREEERGALFDCGTELAPESKKLMVV
jgi:hypothetical protein